MWVIFKLTQKNSSDTKYHIVQMPTPVPQDKEYLNDRKWKNINIQKSQQQV